MSGDRKRYLILKGGKGGNGNMHYATSTMQAPKYAQPGQPSRTLELRLELKVIADVGLVGFPNVGKSTLLSRASNAKPRIANYHFTTLTPILGVVDLDNARGFVMADIPGLIEGAADGAGLGHEFLAHIERTKLLVHVVDAAGSEGRDPVEDIKAINKELASYEEEIGNKKQILAANKCDLLGEDRENLDLLRAHVEELGYTLYEMSAVTHEGTRQLMSECARRLAELPPVQHYEADYVPPEPVVDTSEDLEITHFDDMWVVEGPWLQRLVATVNFSDYESRMYFDRILREAGVFERMEQMGVQNGDTVSMYDLMFEYQE
jgi:GTP-binding protein